MNRRLIPLLVASIMLVANLVLALTPAAWILQGRTSESYPEVAFLMLGVPLASISAVAGIFIARNQAGRSPANRYGLNFVAALGIAGNVALLLVNFVPPPLVGSKATAAILNSVGLGALVIGLALVVLIAFPQGGSEAQKRSRSS
jgi:hypothetical protein